MADILALARAEQENAKTFLRWRLGAHACTLVASVLALFVHDPVTYLLALAAVATECTAWVLRRQAQTLHERAERGRRMGVLDKALGEAPNGLDVARMEGEFSSQARQWEARWKDPNYWATQGTGHAKGPSLLRINLQESAFWSEQLYRRSARFALARLIVFTVVVVFVALMLLTLGGGSGGQTFARVAAVVLAVVVSMDELDVMLGYLDAASVAKETVDRLANVDMADLRSALTVFVDYSVATAAAPPIPTGIYERQHDAIEALWKKASNRVDPGEQSADAG
jgi:hypothetical protein